MNPSQLRKIGVHLSDYTYLPDLERRLLISKLSPFEIEVLNEIIHNSLKFPVKELAELMDVSGQEILTVLEKLLPLSLFTFDGNTISVQKESRKYFETQLERFDEDFTPDIDYFQSLLRHVPIHLLPLWFSIPKSTDDIFGSIIENYFLTPELYTKYLRDLQFDNKYAAKIIKMLHKGPEYIVKVSDIIEKFSLTPESLEELIIVLEFNKICCLKYIRENDSYRRILVPFHEWHSYLLSMQSLSCKPISDPEHVNPLYSRCFGFAEDIDLIVQKTGEAGLEIVKIKEFCSINFHRIPEKMVQLGLVTVRDNHLIPSENMGDWKHKSIQDKAMALYFTTLNGFRKIGAAGDFNDRDIREIEKSLKAIIGKGWVYLNDFIDGMIAPIGKSPPVMLQKKGRLRNYALPKYDEKQISFIKSTLEKHLLESGMVNLGSHNDQICISVTPFGKLSLGD